MTPKRKPITVEGIIEDEFLARRAMLDPLEEDIVMPFWCNPIPKPRASSPPEEARAGTGSETPSLRGRSRLFTEAKEVGAFVFELLCFVGVLVVFAGIVLFVGTLQ